MVFCIVSPNKADLQMWCNVLLWPPAHPLFARVSACFISAVNNKQSRWCMSKAQCCLATSLACAACSQSSTICNGCSHSSYFLCKLKVKRRPEEEAVSSSPFVSCEDESVCPPCILPVWHGLTAGPGRRRPIRSSVPESPRPIMNWSTDPTADQRVSQIHGSWQVGRSGRWKSVFLSLHSTVDFLYFTLVA